MMKIISNLTISVLISGPFFVLGISSLVNDSRLNPFTLASLIIAVLLLIIGVYISFRAVAPEPPLQDTETELARRHPSMKPAIARMIIGLPFLVVAGYLFQGTTIPYIYPFVVFVVGMYLFFQGAIRYIRNLHTTYVVTDLRAMKMYRFLWLNTREIPVSRIVSISEARGFFELLTNRGTVVVASGVGERQIVRMQDITNPAPVADVLRQSLA